MAAFVVWLRLKVNTKIFKGTTGSFCFKMMLYSCQLLRCIVCSSSSRLIGSFTFEPEGRVKVDYSFVCVNYTEGNFSFGKICDF